MKPYLRREGAVTVVELVGELDTVRSRELQHSLGETVSQGGHIVLDLTLIRGMSSVGLRLLLSLSRRVARLGGRLVLAGVATEILDIMDVTGFLEHFTTRATVDEALKIWGDLP